MRGIGYRSYGKETFDSEGVKFRRRETAGTVTFPGLCEAEVRAEKAAGGEETFDSEGIRFRRQRSAGEEETGHVFGIHVF